VLAGVCVCVWVCVCGWVGVCARVHVGVWVGGWGVSAMKVGCVVGWTRLAS